ncbi:MAG: 3-isopropylmalate dehydratase large subunit [Candidatus Zixiibacteriota bacterium]|nr:MAG: 3-isopropylmalate dehydratase large subunit [candidate division Zixibacteria bacterium]
MSPRRKMPTKAELIRLQKLYKTDEKIGERLGGVPGYLVAYWRRKKNVPKHSLPKFSEKEIRDLWERFGDDDKCGLELGISKAAFYNWRRRYGIREKPAFLKLEQLELNFPGIKLHPATNSLYGKKTLSGKIIARAAQLEKIEVGETVEVEPDLVVSHGNAGRVIEVFRKHGAELVWNPNKIAIALANCFSEEAGDNLPETHQKIRDFAKRQGIRAFYDVAEGACHQVALEKGQVLPGQLILGTDRYTATFGCISAAAARIDVEQAASIWATGKVNVPVQPTIRIDINGRRARGVYSRDVAHSVIRQLAAVDVNDKALEFYGSVVSRMTISERFTLTNLTIDTGASSAICGFDSTTRRYLTGRTGVQYTPLVADKNAEYEQIYQINIDHLTPQLARPSSSIDIKPVAESEGLPVGLVILGTGSNGRFDDLRIAAEVLKGRQINRECRLLIYPASRSVYLEALKKGLVRVLVEAGAVIMYPGFWDCPGTGERIVARGERVLATSNNRLVNRLNVEDADVYLCSPATAAASALNGSITDPARYVK